MPSSKRSVPSDLKRVLSAMSQTFVPDTGGADLTGIENEVISGCGRLMFNFSKLTIWLVTWGLRFLEWFPFLFGFGFNRFSKLSLESRTRYLDGWARSRWSVRREFFKAMKGLVMMAYFADRRIWNYIGYNPEPHMEERIRMREEILEKGEGGR